MTKNCGFKRVLCLRGREGGREGGRDGGREFREGGSRQEGEKERISEEKGEGEMTPPPNTTL
jgi:hypothetical protein